MRILSHRGYWRSLDEKNSAVSFQRSFSLGFGTETDLRDHDGALAVSHDPPRGKHLSVDELLMIHARLGRQLPLALNIKADGLQELLTAALARHEVEDAFVFDMSAPDTLHWIRRGVPVFTRHSDIEADPLCYADAAGVWLDAFHDDWWDLDVIRRHRDRGKRVCVVSPELHGRDRRRVWDRLQCDDVLASDRVMICTDHPEEAAEAFPSGK